MKKCLILINSYKTEAPQLGQEMQSFLKQRGVESSVFSYNGRESGAEQPAVEFKGNDFVITLGGDGTVLFACRACGPLGIPVFPVNLGEFGFLAAVQTGSWQKDLDSYLSGKAHVAQRHLVRTEVIHEGKTAFTSLGMNDCVISSRATSRLVNLGVSYNHASLGPFKANGLIISTATGSTAYSAAAGGPIIDPSLDCLVLTPVSSFSLSARPLVFGGQGEVAVTILPSRDKTGITIDGQIYHDLEEGDAVIANISEYKASLICATQESFYAALQSKLNWSGGPRA